LPLLAASDLLGHESFRKEIIVHGRMEHRPAFTLEIYCPDHLYDTSAFNKIKSWVPAILFRVCARWIEFIYIFSNRTKNAEQHCVRSGRNICLGVMRM